MAREWNGVSGEAVILGDIAAARFSRDTPFTFLVFFAPRPGGDERAIIEKVNRQFYARVQKSVDGSKIQVITGGGDINFTGTSALSTNVWYLLAVTNNGTDTANNCHIYLLNMSGTLVENADFTRTEDEIVLTGDVQYGRLLTVHDEYDGGMFCGSYFNRVFSEQDVRSYLRDPYRTSRQYGSTCVFFNPLFGTDAPEPDWSGNGHSGTVNGTNFGIFRNPPVGPLVGFDIPWVSLASTATSTRGLVSFAELGTPLVSTRGLISWCELGIPSSVQFIYPGFFSPLKRTYWIGKGF
jgi:hypothetical protein